MRLLAENKSELRSTPTSSKPPVNPLDPDFFLSYLFSLS
jgi:hypothetical protein